MMKLDESSSSNSVPSIGETVNGDVNGNDSSGFVEKDNKISLTQLWEYVVKHKKLPENLNLDTLLSIINQKLRYPEWEVRQHALRVIVDIIPLIDKEELDDRIEIVLNEIVRNLGHIGPAVRKGAVDSLRTFLYHSNKPNSILRELIGKGVENSTQNKVNSNISLGIIIAVPFLINQKISFDALRYIIHVLLDKLEQILHQESILRSILRIRGIIGNKRFEEILDTHKAKREFEMLCEIYNLPEPTACDFAIDFYDYTNDYSHLWSDHNQNKVKTAEDIDNKAENSNDSTDKVILETEIKLEEGQAITMKIHEEENPFNDSSDTDEETRGIRTFKVLTDDSDEDYEMLRKTPRRVRFGGEIVKMRTPDSDSNHPSDADETLIINTKKSNPVIQIQYKTTTKVSKSHIPVRVSSKQNASKSEPNSPKKIKISKLYESSPNLAKDYEKLNRSRIPRKNNLENREVTKRIKIKVRNTRREDHPKKLETPQNQLKNDIGQQEVKQEEDPKPPDNTTDSPNQEKPKSQKLATKSSGQNFERFSPIPVHNQIELFHNLTRSPERKPKNDQDPPEQASRQLTTADQVLLERLPHTIARKIHTADVVHRTVVNGTTNNQLVFINNYNSFHVYSNGNGRVEELVDSPIPTKDTGECLTCSSSGSDATNERVNCDCLGGLNHRVLLDIQNRDDIRIKQRGLEELLKCLKDPKTLKSAEDNLPFLLNILFSSEQLPIFQSISEQNLNQIFRNLEEETIINKLPQIAYHLSKTGSPVGVRLALIILKRVPAKFLIDQLLSESILAAKSSKIREGALQILMTISRIFPSTEMDIPKCVDCVVRLLKDKKRKVRQAALETIATLTQLSTTSIVLDVVTKIIQNYPDKDQLLRVIRTRLSRKQLPTVDLNGNVYYSTPAGQTEIEWLSKAANGSADSNSSNTHQEDLNHRIYGESNSAPPTYEKTNYWIQKKMQAEQATRTLDIDWNSGESKDEADNKNSQPQIWAIDPATIYTTPDKLKQINGTLRPVFVIQPDSQNHSISSERYPSSISKNHKQTNTDHKEFRHNRGRSFSPPKRKSPENDRFIQNDDTRHNFYKSDQFHKSFSSDQLIPTQRCNFRNSGSSSNSGSSLRNGVWNKDVKSGIPVPINTDSRFKFRTSYNDVKRSTPQFYNGKLPSTDGSLEKFSAHTRPVMARQPFSSGSESSGYFTPPAEPHLPNIFDQNADTSSRLKSSQSERFVPVAAPPIHQENFTVIDSDYCENLKAKSAPVQHYSYDSVDFQHPKEFGDSVERVSSPEEKDSLDEEDDDHEDEVEVIPEDNYSQKTLQRQSTANSFEDFDFIANQAFGERKIVSSKSEAELSIASEPSRKTINSAPTVNKSFDNFNHYEDTPSSSTKTSLPGSIVDFQEIEMVQEVIEKSPTKTICKKTITRQVSRKRSIKTIIKTPDYSELPFSKPKESLNEILTQMDSSEWEANVQGLQGLIRFIRHHQPIVESNMHTVSVALGKHIKNLRSQVARSACMAACDIFKSCKKSIEMELEELATPLLHRTADTNKFLRGDANAALDNMCLNLSPPKVVNVITTRGSNHQNAIVRCASVRLLYGLCHRLGAEKVFQLPKDTRDRILVTGANMLTEGSLETRKHAKMLLGLLAGHSQFQKAMAEAVPSHIMRHISKTLKTLT